MTRQDYIKQQAASYKSACDKRRKISNRYLSDQISHKQKQNLNAELNFLGMQIAQIEERIAYAIGLLIPENAQKEYRPSPYHTYKGIELELKNTKFEL